MFSNFHAPVAGKSRKDGDHGPLFHQMMHDINTATFPDPEVRALHSADSSPGAVALPRPRLLSDVVMGCMCRGRRKATTCPNTTPSWLK
jgi:hypothetical protein